MDGRRTPIPGSSPRTGLDASDVKGCVSSSTGFDFASSLEENAGPVTKVLSRSQMEELGKKLVTVQLKKRLDEVTSASAEPYAPSPVNRSYAQNKPKMVRRPIMKR